MFPPGVHTVTPMRGDPDAKPESITLTIDESTATRLEAIRAEYQAKADAGEGDAPYFDFNHEDAEASFWPKRIFWGGDDPLLGGVRAEGESSKAGEEAIAGKIFRRFSPVFYAKDGVITGAPVNMGGLVNRAAFERIQPFFARPAGPSPAAPEPTDPPTDPTPSMNEEQIQALQDENAELKAKLDDQQKQLDDLTAAAKAATEKEAETTVELAAKEGRIGTSEEIRGKWKASLIANPENKELLMALPVNPAFQEAFKAKGADPANAAKAEEEPKTLAEIIQARRHPQAD